MAMKVELGGVIIAKLKQRKRIELQVPHGRHRVSVKLAWFDSDRLEIDSEEDENVLLAAAAGEKTMEFGTNFLRPHGVLELRQIKVERRPPSD